MHYVIAYTVYPHFQMQMTTSCPPGVPNIADDLPDLHLLAGGIECGKTNPKFDTLYAIIRTLSVDANRLFYGGHSTDNSTSAELQFLLDTCTEEELAMILDLSRTILAHTRSNGEIGAVATV